MEEALYKGQKVQFHIVEVPLFYLKIKDNQMPSNVNH